jgi:hypothetical protein
MGIISEDERNVVLRLNAPPSFAETLHARLMPIAPTLAEKLSKFIETRTGLQSNSKPVPRHPD